MNKLERWMPFKFARKNKKDEAVAAPRTLEPFGSFFGAPFNEMMQAFFEDAGLGRFESDRFFGDFSPARFRPTIDVVDEEQSIKVTAELPGMKKDDIELQLHDDVLTLRGEKKNVEESRENGVFRTERFYGAFHRNIPMPADIDAKHVEAKFEDGVLTVRIPKAKDGGEPAKTISIA